MLAFVLFYYMIDYFYDTCSLIYLTKIQAKEYLPSLGNVIVSPSVHRELIESPEKFPDAKILQHNFTRNIIHEVKKENININPIPNLGRGELETIILSGKKKGMLITDDKQAFKYSQEIGLNPISSEIILVKLIQQGIVSVQEFEEKLNMLANLKSLKPDIINFLKQEGLKKNTSKN